MSLTLVADACKLSAVKLNPDWFIVDDRISPSSALNKLEKESRNPDPPPSCGEFTGDDDLRGFKAEVEGAVLTLAEECDCDLCLNMLVKLNFLSNALGGEAVFPGGDIVGRV